MSQGMWAPLEAGKDRKRMLAPGEAPEGICPHLCLSRWDSETCDLQNVWH